MFASVRLAKLDPGNLRYCVSFVRRFQRPAQQLCFRDWLLRELRVNTGASKKEKFACTVLVGRTNDVVLDPQILEQKLDWKIVVCLDAADFCRRENDDSWLFIGKKFRDCRFMSEIEFRSVANQQV